MKILIMGSEGFVGKNLVKGLSEKHDIYTSDQLDSTDQNYSKCDITNYDSVEKIVRDVDAVIHLTAHSLVSSLDGSITNARVNIMGLLNLLESCRKNSVPKVIFTSASSLVGEPKSFHVNEDHTPKPKTAYGITKLTSEHYLRLYHELYGIDYTVFRFFNIYGPFQKNGLIPSIFNKIQNNDSITIFGKGDQVRDYVYIEDILPFFEQAASSEIGKNKVFNMGTGKGSTILEIVKNMSEILKIEPKIEYQPVRPGEIGNFVADTTLLHETFGKVPSTDVKIGLSKTIDWLKNNS
ncbi:MAG: NAD-dependent epimerase/dehydratase family protein [Nitrosarchaeum sp.]|jgi:UDP-glucose 4-epimerase|uniref:NAD-dependent epimerase/dehydratase family protein n=1 Tax=Nitrosarchaeum sp. TaxID=2026886 RepID=UPI002DF21142|nr:NAD-dependent epimerase/dehydratase family protein [Nitrosarchaeum sp.]MEC4847595.1 NAD-dependent epimerase/dehydratase family protein [Nitrosarchaeum sp.]